MVLRVRYAPLVLVHPPLPPLRTTVAGRASAGEAAAAVVGSRGRPSTGSLRPSLDLLQVQLGTLMLRDPSFVAGDHHDGRNHELRRTALFPAEG